MVHIQRFAHDVRHGHARVQRGIRILEHHRRLRAELLQVRFRLDGLAIVNDFARRRLVQLEDGAPNSRLAAAGFAHQTERFALIDGEGHIIDRLQRLGAEEAHVDVKVFFQSFDFQQWLVHLRFRHRALLLPP